jgi:hypothetical protein
MEQRDITQQRDIHQLRDITQEVIVDIIMPFLPHDDWVNAIRALRSLFDNESRSVLRKQYPSIVDSEIDELMKEAYPPPRGAMRFESIEQPRRAINMYVNWWKGIEKKFESLANFPLACKEESEDSRLRYEPYSPIASREIGKEISVKGHVNTFKLTRRLNHVFNVERNILNGIFEFKEEKPIVTYQLTMINISNKDEAIALTRSDSYEDFFISSYKKERKDCKEGENPTQVIRNEK